MHTDTIGSWYCIRTNNALNADKTALQSSFLTED